MTEAEYLEFTDSQDERYEYSAGYVYAMAGSSVRHNIITASLIQHLGNEMAGRDCTVVSSDTRIRIEASDAYRHADLAMFCGHLIYWNDRVDTITNPFLIVEVLSPSTEIVDRNKKLTEYTQIDSLQAYLLVSQEEPKVEGFFRTEAGNWHYDYAVGDGKVLHLPPLEVDLDLSKVYQRVTWETPDE